jgi:hypothetical protein
MQYLLDFALEHPKFQQNELPKQFERCTQNRELHPSEHFLFEHLHEFIQSEKVAVQEAFTVPYPPHVIPHLPELHEHTELQSEFILHFCFSVL